MSYTLVVAHYNENLDWLSAFPEESVHIYSKGKYTLDVPYKVDYLPNVGRESHTYLHYICTNYESLPDMVAFSQGSDDHLKADDMLERITTFGDKSISGPITTASLYRSGLDHKNHIQNWKGDLTPCEYNFIKWFKKFVNPTEGPILNMIFGACFVVSRNAILSRSKEYYEQLLDQCIDSVNPEVGHYFERSWYYIFNC
jgi:hypothetical protein